MNVRQLRDVIVVPVLTALGMFSPNAVNLLLGTAAQESQLGHFIVQQGIGFNGGIGIYQMQKAAYNNIWDRQISNNIALKMRIRLLLGYDIRPVAERMASDLLLATAMARLYYHQITMSLPEHNDIPGLAAYWKKWYNTVLGKGTEQEFVDNYAKYIEKGLA